MVTKCSFTDQSICHSDPLLVICFEILSLVDVSIHHFLVNLGYTKQEICRWTGF